MKRKIILFGLLMLSAAILTGCCMSHEWQEATCTAPKTCAKCEKTEGEALGHTWEPAACEVPETCSACGETQGEALDHTWKEADCETPETCSVCAKTQGEALGHEWQAATCEAPETCSVCGGQQGEPKHSIEYGAVRKAETGEQVVYEGRCTICGSYAADNYPDWETFAMEYIAKSWKVVYIVADGEYYLPDGVDLLVFNQDGTVDFGELKFTCQFHGLVETTDGSESIRWNLLDEEGMIVFTALIKTGYLDSLWLWEGNDCIVCAPFTESEPA